MLCIGHRGAAGIAPENTLAGVERAIACGVAAIEVDVQLVEGELVVFHDARLERTTNGHGLLAAQGLAAIRRLDAGEGEPIPTLPELLDRLDQRVAINIELKGPGCATALAEVIAHYRRRGWPEQLFLVSSFDHAQLEKLRAIDPVVRIGLLSPRLTPGLVTLAGRLAARSIHLPVESFTPAQLTTVHRAGCALYLYTLNEPGQARSLAALGVDGVFTDHPERLCRATGTTGWP